MFKAILLFIKTHAIATAITTTVVVGSVTTAVVVPKVQEYQLTKEIEPQLNMLVSSSYKTSQTENGLSEVINEDTSEIIEEKQNKPITFEVVENKTQDGTSYVIVPSYDKDFSLWSKEEKEAYQIALNIAAAQAEADYNFSVQKEKETLDNIQAELDLIENSWSKYYPCGVRYNSYTKRVERKNC